MASGVKSLRDEYDAPPDDWFHRNDDRFPDKANKIRSLDDCLGFGSGCVRFNNSPICLDRIFWITKKIGSIPTPIVFVTKTIVFVTKTITEIHVLANPLKSNGMARVKDNRRWGKPDQARNEHHSE